MASSLRSPIPAVKITGAAPSFPVLSSPLVALKPTCYAREAIVGGTTPLPLQPETCLSLDDAIPEDSLVSAILDDPVAVDDDVVIAAAEDFFSSPPVVDPAASTAVIDDHLSYQGRADATMISSADVAVPDADELGDFLLDAVSWL